jgi:UDPglucose 6-dehydrogenase
MRDAPSLDIIPALLKAGYRVQAYDPVAMENAKKLLPAEVEFCKDAKAALRGAAALAVLTEWDEFRGVDLATMVNTMDGSMLFDGRNVYEPREVRTAGLKYFGMGVA